MPEAATATQTKPTVPTRAHSVGGASTAVDAPAEKKAVKPIIQARFKTLSFSARDWGNIHGVTLEKGTAFEDVLDPSFWSSVAPSLLPGDWVRVLIDDGSFEALLTVRQTSGPGNGRQNNRAVVAKLQHWTFEAMSETSLRPLSHRISYEGTHHKWSIVDAKSGEVVRDGFAAEDDARAALTAMLRTQK
jgi:hypothetical protein